MESNRELYIDPALARREYLKKFTAHMAGVESTCRKLGITSHRLTTDHPLEVALFDFLRARMQRSKLIRRK